MLLEKKVLLELMVLLVLLSKAMLVLLEKKVLLELEVLLVSKVIHVLQGKKVLLESMVLALLVSKLGDVGAAGVKVERCWCCWRKRC